MERRRRRGSGDQRPDLDRDERLGRRARTVNPIAGRIRAPPALLRIPAAASAWWRCWRSTDARSHEGL